ncbi:MAG: BAX inhibitor (BI)-1/YccA family protein, partial [Arenicellales bacterium]
MINRQTLSASRPVAQGVEFNKVLKNTYALLSATLLFSALTAGLSMMMGWPHPGLIVTLVGYFGLLFLAGKFRNS